MEALQVAGNGKFFEFVDLYAAVLNKSTKMFSGRVSRGLDLSKL